jgi:hypothetical protein
MDEVLKAALEQDPFKPGTQMTPSGEVTKGDQTTPGPEVRAQTAQA